jgi:Zn ribbon nucleic-acid-binding protein
MAIDDSGDWWVGSEPADIEPYLVEFTSSDAAYPATVFLPVRCGCASDRFRLARAQSVTQRTCVACGREQYISRHGKPDDWEAAVAESGPIPYDCVGCDGDEANLMVGFAGYPEAPEIDGAKWFYVGARCAACGVLSCFNDGKVGRVPAARVYREVIGDCDS